MLHCLFHHFQLARKRKKEDRLKQTAEAELIRKQNEFELNSIKEAEESKQKKVELIMKEKEQELKSKKVAGELKRNEEEHLKRKEQEMRESLVEINRQKKGKTTQQEDLVLSKKENEKSLMIRIEKIRLKSKTEAKECRENVIDEKQNRFDNAEERKKKEYEEKSPKIKNAKGVKRKNEDDLKTINKAEEFKRLHLIGKETTQVKRQNELKGNGEINTNVNQSPTALTAATPHQKHEQSTAVDELQHTLVKKKHVSVRLYL